jgi:hypothetical protein
MSTGEVGAVCFGVVIGWIVYRTLRRDTNVVTLQDIATVVGAVGGAAVTAIFKSESLFGCYSIGLAVGFFGYLILGHTVFKGSPWLRGGG